LTAAPLYLALLAAAGGLSIRNYLRLEVEGRDRLLLARSLAIGVLMMVLVLPAWIRPRVQRLKPRITVLVDSSASMRREAWPGGPSRFDRATQALDGLRARYGEGFEYQVRHFDVGLRDGSAPPIADGEGTDLARALHQTLRQGDERTRALLMVSDGRDTRGTSPVLPARSAAYPIHTLGVGAVEDPRPNVQVVDLQAPEEGFAGGDVTVKARLDFQRVPEGTKVPLQLELDGEVVHNSSVVATRDTTQVTLRFRPPRGGLVRLSLRALPGQSLQDRSAEDDRAESSMQVRAEPISVLALAARPGPDLAFLRRVLQADPRFRLTVVHGLGADRPVRLPASGHPAALDAVPLVILSGFDATRVPPAVQAELVRFLEEREGALLLIGNGPREWKDLFASQLGPLLPARAPDEFRPLEKRFGVDTSKLDSHPVTRILEHRQANRQAWQRLPPIAPGLRLDVAGGARVMLSFPYYPRNIPLLASRAVGRGVVLALNSRETYLWSMLPAAHGDPEQVHERFLAGLAAWAADPVRVGGERLVLSRLRFRPGERVRVRWQGAPGTTPPDTVQVVPLDGGDPRTLAVTPGDDGGLAEMEAPPPGFYEVRSVDGGAPPVPLAVHPSRDELLRPEPDPGLLRAIADAAGGSYLPLTADADLETLPRVDATPVVKREHTGVYWLDEPLVLAAVLLLFCLEWGMRRRRNLV
jgi:hypothetical protein